MSLNSKIITAVFILVSIWTILIKVYFSKNVNSFLEKTIQSEMEKDTDTLERIIITIANIANGNKNIVRKALNSIGTNPSIPIDLKRSSIIERQYGFVKEKSIHGDIEKKVLESKLPKFIKTEKELLYFYPLKAKPVCQQCHQLADGTNVKLGSVLGIAIKKVPRSRLTENKLSYFVLDLFWENLLAFLVIIGFLIFLFYIYYKRPFDKLRKKAHIILLEDDSVESIKNKTDFSEIEQLLDIQLDEGETRKNSEKE